MILLKKIVSGGQTGADLAALDAAVECGFPYGGWIPKGRKNEDGEGRIPLIYDRLQENNSPDFDNRTEQNVRDSDGTVILFHGELAGGSLKTAEFTSRHSKPLLSLDLNGLQNCCAVKKIRAFLEENQIAVLNVAGPRRSQDALIYEKTHRIMHSLLSVLRPGESDDSLDLWMNLREERLSNIRHWDQIRWLIPSWYATVTVLFAGFGVSQDLSLEAVRTTATIMAAFGFLSLWLSQRLVTYHNDALLQWTKMLSDSLLPERQRRLLDINLPYKLSLWVFPWPATIWFMLALVILTWIFAFLAISPELIEVFYLPR